MPAYTDTLGPEAIDLAAAAGLVLDPWQAMCVCDIAAVQDTGQWAAFDTCTVVQRQCGKGAIIETLELAGLFLWGERLILHSAHEYKTAQEAFLRIKSLVEGSDDLTRYLKAVREANGEQQIILMSGARLRFVARSKGSGRGFTGQRNILDESYALTRTQLAALLPTMSAQPNPQLNMFSTVPDVDTMPEPGEAVLPSVRKRALAAVRVGDPGRLAYHDWSADNAEIPDGNPDEDPAVAREFIELAYKCNPAMGIRVTQEFVEGELAALGVAKFAVERLGVWPEDEADRWGVIPKRAWLSAADATFERPTRVAFAVTLSTDRQWATIGAAGPIGDDRIGVLVIDRREGTGWVIPRLRELVERWKPVAVVIDKGSPAGAIAAEAEEAQIELTPILTRDVAAAAGAFWDGIAGHPARDPETGQLGRDPRVLRHREQSELTAAVAAAAKRPLSTTWAWDQLASAVDITPLIAVSNALWGYRTREHEPIAWVFTL